MVIFYFQKSLNFIQGEGGSLLLLCVSKEFFANVEKTQLLMNCAMKI